MALFKMLQGDESNISLDITPFHEGWVYITNTGYFYVDLNIGTAESPNNQRIKLNAQDAETIAGYTFDKIMEAAKAIAANQDVVVLHEAQAYTDAELATARINAINQDAVVLAESQTYTNRAIEAAKIDTATQDAVVLHEAQAYTDSAIVQAETDIKAYIDEAILGRLEKLESSLLTQ